MKHAQATQALPRSGSLLACQKKPKSTGGEYPYHWRPACETILRDKIGIPWVRVPRFNHAWRCLVGTTGRAGKSYESLIPKR